MSNGPGPHATPTVAGDYIFTTGATGKLHCLDKQTGKLIWMHDLFKEFNATVRINGYSSSPLAHKNTVIVMSGHRNPNLMAIKVGGSGDLAGTKNVLYTNQRGNSYTPSPVLQDNKLYFISDNL